MKTSIVLVFLMLIISHIYAENSDVLAILPFSGQGIEKSELKEISIFLRNEINKSGKYRVMDHDGMVNILRQKGVKDVNSCNEIDCASIMGGMLLKKYIVQGRIGKIKQTYAINLRIISVDNNEVLLDIEEFFTGTKYGLKNTIISEIVKEIVSVKLENRKFSLQDKTKGISANSMLFRPVVHTPESAPIMPKKNNKELNTKTKSEENQRVTFHNLKNKLLEIKQSKPVRRFRSQPIYNLQSDDVKKIIAYYDFFCTYSRFSSQWSNPKQMKKQDHFIQIPGDCTVVDVNSHLMWEREGSQQRLSIDQVSSHIDSINKINFGNFSDWRLPSLDEAMSIMVSENSGGVYTAKVFSRKQNSIWTSDKVNPETSWVVRYDKGRCNFGTYKYLRYVRLVRSIIQTNSTMGITPVSAAVTKHLDTF